MPHLPQLSGSVASSLHVSTQVVSPWGQVHAPALQLAEGGHAFPHLPQFLASVCSLTQVAPHSVRPTAHVDWHVPFSQVSPGSHACPHEPQFLASVDVLVQVPLHELSAPGQAVAGGSPQLPEMHW